MRAPEYVEAMWRMLQREEPRDFVIATGESYSLRDFVASVFEHCGLDWRDHLETDPGLLRPSEIREGKGDARKAEELLGWKANKRMPDVAKAMVDAETKT